MSFRLNSIQLPNTDASGVKNVLAVSYMGTKRHLAPIVADLVGDSKAGPLLDLFSGMCSVGQAVAPARQVWSNDLQRFAYLVAKCQFCSPVASPVRSRAEEQLAAQFLAHRSRLEASLSAEIEVEREALSQRSIQNLGKLFEDGVFRANRIRHGEGGKHRLFVDRYSGTYFGVAQSIEIDAIRYAIDLLDGACPEKEWFLVALCSAMSRCANTTGHFAQALNPKESNIGKVLGQRLRSVWNEFLSALDRLGAVGAPNWRKRNRAFQSEAGSLLAQLKPANKVGVVYADPPYTADQYSRYYHLYETAIFYDYPAARGRGLYRDNRPVSQFSHASKVRASLEQLIAGTSRLKADLILSYPAGGLLPSSRSQITEMITEHFGRSPEVFPIFHNHSTMGASKGDAIRQVTELIYRVRS